jgi:hypothetical protein
MHKYNKYMENTNDSNTYRCGKQTVKRNTILTQDYLSSTPLFLSLSLSRSWGHSKTSNSCPEKKIFNPDKKKTQTPLTRAGTTTNTYPGTILPTPTNQVYSPLPTEREEKGERRPLPKSPRQNFSTQERYTTLTLSFRSFTEHSTIEPAIVITADPYTPNRLTPSGTSWSILGWAFIYEFRVQKPGAVLRVLRRHFCQ